MTLTGASHHTHRQRVGHVQFADRRQQQPVMVGGYGQDADMKGSFAAPAV